VDSKAPKPRTTAEGKSTQVKGQGTNQSEKKRESFPPTAACHQDEPSERPGDELQEKEEEQGGGIHSKERAAGEDYIPMRTLLLVEVPKFAGHMLHQQQKGGGRRKGPNHITARMEHDPTGKRLNEPAGVPSGYDPSRHKTEKKKEEHDSYKS